MNYVERELLPEGCRTARGRSINRQAGKNLKNHCGDAVVPFMNDDGIGAGMVTEKMDGIFGWWNGKDQFWSWTGNPLIGTGHNQARPDAAATFLSKMPLGVELTGELAHDNYAALPGEDDCVFWVFDIPLMDAEYHLRWRYLNQVSFGEFDDRIDTEID